LFLFRRSYARVPPGAILQPRKKAGAQIVQAPWKETQGTMVFIRNDGAGLGLNMGGWDNLLEDKP
jgi:hypothetical protein